MTWWQWGVEMADTGCAVITADCLAGVVLAAALVEPPKTFEAELVHLDGSTMLFAFPIVVKVVQDEEGGAG
jgi:hypothetical protein